MQWIRGKDSTELFPSIVCEDVRDSHCQKSQFCRPPPLGRGRRSARGHRRQQQRKCTHYVQTCLPKTYIWDGDQSHRQQLQTHQGIDAATFTLTSAEQCIVESVPVQALVWGNSNRYRPKCSSDNPFLGTHS